MSDQSVGELAAIWAEHRSTTLDRLRVLEGAAIAVLEGTLSEDLRMSARHEAHTLAGSVAFFGFTEGSALARDLELRFATVPPQGDAPAVAELVAALRGAIDRPVALRAASAQRLLVLDPDPGMAARLGGAAATTGATVVTADDRESALRLVRASAIDAAIIAAAMPDGVAIIEALVAHGTPVIATGDGADAGLRIAAGRAGAISFADQGSPPEVIVADALRAAGEPQALLGARIVAVDDDPTVISAMRQFLGWYGAEVVASDPGELWEALATHDPHLVVLDVEMPGVSGIDLCHALRADPAWRQLPVVFLTATDDPDTMRDLLSAGADDCITKPVAEATLALRLARVLQARDRARPAATAVSSDAPDILVVDDDPVVADILLRALAARGHQARWIEDGAVAARTLESSAGRLPKVVLLDIDLPGLDGYGVLRRAAAAGVLATCRFIVLTGRSSESETVRALELGAFDHVAKPFSIPVLMQRVRRALDT